MRKGDLEEVLDEMERLRLRIVRLCQVAVKDRDRDSIYPCSESGAVKRASMDLTRTLAQLRKP